MYIVTYYHSSPDFPIIGPGTRSFKCLDIEKYLMQVGSLQNSNRELPGLDFASQDVVNAVDHHVANAPTSANRSNRNCCLASFAKGLFQVANNGWNQIRAWIVAPGLHKVAHLARQRTHERRLPVFCCPILSYFCPNQSEQNFGPAHPNFLRRASWKGAVGGWPVITFCKNASVVRLLVLLALFNILVFHFNPKGVL